MGPLQKTRALKFAYPNYFPVPVLPVSSQNYIVGFFFTKHKPVDRCLTYRADQLNHYKRRNISHFLNNSLNIFSNNYFIIPTK